MFFKHFSSMFCGRTMRKHEFYLLCSLNDYKISKMDIFKIQVLPSFKNGFEWITIFKNNLSDLEKPSSSVLQHNVVDWVFVEKPDNTKKKERVINLYCSIVAKDWNVLSHQYKGFRPQGGGIL